MSSFSLACMSVENPDILPASSQLQNLKTYTQQLQ